MRILQVLHEMLPRRTARAGGELGTFQTVMALSDLGHELHLALCGAPYDIEPEVVRKVAGVHWISPSAPNPLMRVAGRLFQPETWALRAPDASGYVSAVLALARGLDVDLVWADGIQGIATAPRHVFPTIYGHYDFLHLLRPARRASRKRRLVARPDPMTDEALRQLEMRHCSESALVVSISASVVEQLESSGIAATHIPLVGPTLPRLDAQPHSKLRLFLFGNHNTANRAILSEIRNHLWPALRSLGSPVEWHQVGTVRPGQHDEDWEWSRAHFDHTHGFVEDLAKVFSPGDISIVAYPFDTGTRAKFAVAAAYGVPSAGYEVSFKCAPEFTAGRDCIATGSPAELASALDTLARSPTRRAALSAEVRATYERHFTYEAQLPLYERALSRATQRRTPVQNVAASSPAAMARDVPT